MFGRKREREKEWASFEAEAMPCMPDVFRVARWLSGDAATAEDMTQETFFQALKSFHLYTPNTNCRAWLVTILYRVNAKRRMKLGRLKLVEDSEDLVAATVPFEPPIPHDLTDEDMIAALKSLPQNYRDAVLLTDIEEFSYKETAELMSVPIGTVMSRIHRGRALLRQELAAFAPKRRLASGG